MDDKHKETEKKSNVKSTFWEGGSFKFTMTTISPKNQYKKLALVAKNKPLNQVTCHWMRAFNNVKKHKLLQLRSTLSIKLQPAFQDKRRHEDLLRVNLTLYKLRAYIKKLSDHTKQPDFSKISVGASNLSHLAQAQETLTELLTTN